MKKFTLLSIVIVFIATTSQAQVGKGTIVLGGGASFGSTTAREPNAPRDYEARGFSVSPSFGIAIKENLVAGVTLNYGRNAANSVNYPDAEMINTTVGGGVFLRSYMPLSKKFYFFGQADLGGNYTKRKDKNFPVPTSDYKGYGISTYLSPGVAYDVNKWLQLESSLPQFISLGFSKSKSTSPAGLVSKQTTWNANLNVSPSTALNLGVRILLR